MEIPDHLEPFAQHFSIRANETRHEYLRRLEEHYKRYRRFYHNRKSPIPESVEDVIKRLDARMARITTQADFDEEYEENRKLEYDEWLRHELGEDHEHFGGGTPSYVYSDEEPYEDNDPPQ